MVAQFLEATSGPKGGPENRILKLAVEHNQTGIIRLALQHGANVNCRYDAGPQMTPLIFAAKKGYDEVVSVLMEEENCDLNLVDLTKNNALIVATRQHHTQIVKMLVDSGAELNYANQYNKQNALLIAVRAGYEDIAAILLEAGATPHVSDDVKTPLITSAVKHCMIDVVRLMMEGGVDVNVTVGKDRITPLISAVCKGYQNTEILTSGSETQWDDFKRCIEITNGRNYVDIVKLLLRSEQIDVDKQCSGGTALMCAAILGNEEMVRLLLDAGANINAKNCDGQQTALILASGVGHDNVVRMLLCEKAHVDEVDIYGCTALHHASGMGHTNIVQMLMGHGVPLDLPDKEGSTALMCACDSGNMNVVQVLIDAKANLNSVNERGETALCLAIFQGHIKIVNMLFAAGVDLNVQYQSYGTALIYAICQDKLDIVQFLLRHGARADTRHGPYLATPLMVAIMQKLPHIAGVLLSSGAHLDIDATDNDGDTALSLAYKYGYQNIAEKIVQCGGNPNMVHDRNAPQMSPQQTAVASSSSAAHEAYDVVKSVYTGFKFGQMIGVLMDD